MAFFGLIDPEFSGRGLVDRELNGTSLIDAELASVTTASAALDDGDGWDTRRLVSVAATTVLLALSVTTFGYADEVPPTAVPDDTYAIFLQTLASRPSTTLWAVEDELPTVQQLAFEEDSQQLLNYRAPSLLTFMPWDDDDLPVQVSFEDDGTFVQLLSVFRLQTALWSDTDELTVVPAEYDAADLQRPRLFVAVQPTTFDDDFIPLTTVVDDEPWAVPAVSRTAVSLFSWGDVDEVPTLVPTEGEWAPLLNQRLDRFVDPRLWTEPDEWPTPVPPAVVPTESEWTPLVDQRLERQPDARVWNHADEVPNANVPDESSWTPLITLPRSTSLWLADAQDEVPPSVGVALDDAGRFSCDRLIARLSLQTFEAQDENPTAGHLSETELYLFDRRAASPIIVQPWAVLEEFLNDVSPLGGAGHLQDAALVPLLDQRLERRNAAQLWIVLDELPTTGGGVSLPSVIVATVTVPEVRRTVDTLTKTSALAPTRTLIPWTLLGQLPTSPIREAAAVTLSTGRVLVIGGGDLGIVVYDTVYASDDDGLTWNLIGHLPTTLRRHQAVEFQGAVWIVGGQTLSGISQKVWRSLDQGATWAEVGSNAFPAFLARHRMLVFNNAMWVLGGYDNFDSAISSRVYRSADGLSWPEMSPLSIPVADAVAVTFGDRMALLGGRTTGDVPLRTVLHSDNAGANWAEVGVNSLPFAIWVAVGVSHQDKVWLISGEQGTLDRAVLVSDDLGTWVYDGGDQFGFPISTFWACAVVTVHNRVLVVGGFTQALDAPVYRSGVNTVFRFAPENVVRTVTFEG